MVAAAAAAGDDFGAAAATGFLAMVACLTIWRCRVLSTGVAAALDGCPKRKRTS